jgi:replication initiation protein RepC
MSLAMVASQATARDFAGKPGNSETVVHKWRLFRALTEAKTPLGVTDRALSVLHALLSFHQETALTLPVADRRADDEDEDESAGIVVFPSNRELSIRAHGMAPATLRRHLACLVDAGLIIRRDSPNGKRFALTRSKTSPRKCGPRTRRSACCANASRCSAAISSR